MVEMPMCEENRLGPHVRAVSRSRGTNNQFRAEAREAGNVGIYRGTGEVREGLVQEILTQIPAERIVWEAPQKAQQVYFLELLGANVNLGIFAPSEVIPLEATRFGLRASRS